MKTIGIAMAALAAFAVASFAIQGCGGSGGSSSANSVSRGQATLTITWPASDSRLIPAASNSITVTFLNGTTAVSTKTVARPTSGNTSTLAFTGLPTGTALTMTATAYPTTTGTGTAQATASKSVTVTAGQANALAITMASTISSLVLSSTTASVAVGSTTTLTATPEDSAGATVLVSSTLSFASSNTGVATVSSAGVITGVAAGTATITVTESESGKTATATATVTSTSGTTIVDLANAYINSLSTAQQTATVVSSDATHAAKWINLPATPSSDGTQSQRNGVSYSTLSTAQKAAWTALVNAALVNGTGLSQFNQIRAADNYLGTLAGGYSGDYQYVGFVGTPSTSGTWMLQVGGHHIAHNYYYSGTSLQTTTPYFIGVEPTSFTYSSTAYTPMAAQKNAVTALLQSFTTSQLSSAKLSSSFSDVYIGPGKDARSNFPTGTSGRGMLASNLTTAQQTLLKNVIAAWVLGRTTDAYSYQSLYESELSSTYVAYSGNSSAPTTVFTTQGDYLRVDGPHVWIELVCQNGIVISGQIHYHTIWRDRVTDYNADYGF
jgi:hypothetical protein